MRSLLLAVIIVVSLLAATDSLVPTAASKSAREDERPVTVQASGRGNPYVNFSQGRDAVDAAQLPAGEQPVAMAAADFDGDGIADLITADSGGKLRVYHGNAPAPSADPKALKGEIKGAEPFALTDRTFSLGFSPSVIAAGDFDADGHQDILAVADGANSLALLAGDGHGKLSQPRTIQVGGNITAVATGEIGRKDGQTDVAVAVQNDKGALLFVFEHPEGAFKHKPEVFTLPAPATDIAIGNLDEDFYADIAVACGDQLIVVHGRGQAYPWDLIPESGIKRPAAQVETRQMPFSISALAVGRFSDQRGHSLALLGSDGNIHRLEHNSQKQTSFNKLFTKQPNALTTKGLSLPTGVEAGRLAMAANQPMNQTEAEKAGAVFVDSNELKGRGLTEFWQKRQEEAAAKFPKLDKAEIERIVAEGAPKAAAQKERAKVAFMRSISSRPSSLAKWSLETLATDSRLAAAANSSAKMLRVKVSSSSLDDLLVVDSTGNQIQLVSQLPVVSSQSSSQKGDGQPTTNNGRVQITSLETEGSPLAVLPMHLNLDAMNDLVVLRRGANAPSVVMSAAANFFVVTSTDDTGDCQAANPCSLRNAILLSNSSLGQDTISFNLGAGVHTVTPSSQLPVITDAVSLQGSSDPDNNHKLIEISGVNVPAPADGLKVRSSGSFIYNLAINKFPGVSSNGSVIGGSAITLETTANSPTNGNNFVVNNYLGTDTTGSLAKANGGAGLLIFDSDENYVAENVMSGNQGNTGGAGLAVTAGNSNFFVRNIIGLNALGTAKLPNNIGVFFSGANNTFGTDYPNDGNTVSGNGIPDPNSPGQCYKIGNGFFTAAMVVATLVDLNTNELVTLNNNIAGNFFGTNPGGTQPLGNCYAGIQTSPLHQTTIGSITQSGRNIVSDNGFLAIACDEEYFTQSEGGFCAIAGNNIGTDVTGTVAMPNDFRNYAGGLDRSRGIVDIAHNITYSYFGAPGGTTPDGGCTGFCNLYSGNGGGFGNIYFVGYGTIGFFNNYIGTNQQGNQAIPNYYDTAIRIDNALYGAVYVGAVGTDDNNAPISLGNLISGNPSGAINAFTFSYPFLGGYFSPMTIQGNRIGTDASGILAIPNGDSGDISNAQPAIALGRGFTEPTFVGGADPLARNIISGNIGNGMNTFGRLGYPTPITITNNLIGLNAALNPLGNGGNGIAVGGGLGIQIGGTDQEANQIAYNGAAITNGAGIWVGPGASSIKIHNNSIHHNAGLGIDLSTSFNSIDGVTENDCQDLDTGANDLQNFPLLDAPVFNANGTVTVTGALLSHPFEHYTVDIYASTTADPTGHGEGEKSVGSIRVDTDDHGRGPIAFTSSVPVASSSVISATAIDTNGNTSEFSCNAGATCSDSAPSGNSGNKRDYRALAATCSPNDDIIVNIESDEKNDPASLIANICDVFPDAQHPGLQCSLRAAIELAEKRKDKLDTIRFDIPGDGVHTITATEAFLEITDPVTINAASQHGYNGSPLIELTGHGLGISASDSTIRGFAIYGAGGSAEIGIGGSNNKVQACYLGLRADGITSVAGDIVGVKVSDAHGRLTIGGDQDSDGNVISGNLTPDEGGGGVSAGIFISNSSSGRIFISHNKIGTDKTGMRAVPNTLGISITNVSTFPIVENNLISGNSFEGITLRGEGGHMEGLLIRNNVIGGNADGSGPLSNGQAGIRLPVNDDPNQGTIVRVEGNTIVGHTSSDNGTPNAAIVIVDGSHIDILENYIGITRDGRKIPNDYGIVTYNDHPQTIGAVGQGNVIAGNKLSGILNASSHAKIIGNFIGVNAANGDPNLGNGGTGILVDPFYAGLVEPGSEILGTEIANNVISGNGQSGILLKERSNDSKIHDNQIGTAATNEAPAIPNQIGLNIQSLNNQVYNNTIAANHDLGLVSQSSNNHIYQNTIVDTEGIGILLGNSITGLSGMSALRKPTSKNAPQDAPITVEGNEVYNNRIERNGVGIALSEGAKNNFIGTKSTLTGGLGNTIGGNVDGAGIGIFVGLTDFFEGDLESRLPSGNKIVGNNIGQNSAGDILPNRVGLVISQAIDNLFGSSPLAGVSLGNNIVASEEDGIRIGGFKTKGNVITNNFIGTSTLSLEDSNFGNGGDGINLQGTERNDIKFNVVGWNHGNGITVAGVSPQEGETYSSVVSGNQIGVLQDGNSVTPMGNTLAGIHISGATDLLVGVAGNSSSESKNIIAMNGGDGISIEGNSQRLLITNTIIGTTESGAPSLGNTGNGIHIDNGSENTLGGVASVGNIIAGNTGNGVLIENSSTSNKLYGNRIGIFPGANGNAKLGNGLNGVRILNSVGTVVGASFLTTYQNFIDGNGVYGLLLEGSGTQNTLVKNNYIGTDQSDALLGNISHGVFITNQAQNNGLGGPEIEAGNTIAHNGGGGIALDPNAGGGNFIDPNVIYGNASLGIDLNATGIPLPNDPGDADSGPNNLQNFPEFASALLIPGDKLAITYKVDSDPANSNYGPNGLYVEVFKADATLQGQTFIGSTSYTTTNYNAGLPGPAVLIIDNASSLGIHVGDKLVATATDYDGNTSEFTSVNVGVVSTPTAATATIEGTVLTSGGLPVAGVTINLNGTQARTTITDSNGHYRFTEVESNGFYSVSPALANFTFTPANRSFSSLRNRTDAIFTAVPDATESANAIDSPESFVRQQYLDFLGREPDQGGFDYWTSQLAQCGTDTSCLRRKRLDVANAFFFEQEFQQSGAFVYRIYKAALGQSPTFAQFQPDRASVIGGTNLNESKAAFALAFVQRDAFVQLYPATQPAEQFVDAILAQIRQNSGADLSAQRASLTTLYDSTNQGRAKIIQQLADNQSFIDAEYNRSFVLTQYFGYLRRDPDDEGFDFWLGQVNKAPLRNVARQHALVCSFITSAEYQQRFSSVITHNNSECGQ